MTMQIRQLYTYRNNAILVASDIDDNDNSLIFSSTLNEPLDIGFVYKSNGVVNMLANSKLVGIRVSNNNEVDLYFTGTGYGPFSIYKVDNTFVGTFSFDLSYYVKTDEADRMRQMNTERLGYGIALLVVVVLTLLIFVRNR